MQSENLNCPAGQFSLVRPGTPQNSPLRAWDAADEYLITHIQSHYPTQSLMIMNDCFGALGTVLQKHTKIWISDSLCAKEALLQNTQNNDVIIDYSLEGSIALPSAAPTLVAYKIPKNTSFMEYQLTLLANKSTQEQAPITVLLSGMMKHLPQTLLKTLAKYGTLNRLPFVKKAMLVTLTILPSDDLKQLQYPTNATYHQTTIQAHANVFGRNKLDQGTELLLQHANKLPKANLVADLCCGTGIIGLHYAKRNANTRVDFYDESFSAKECVKAGIARNELNTPCQTIWADGLPNTLKEHYELILCNPPFHELHAVGDHIAWRLFKDAKRSLKTQGYFVVVGNRHLAYHNKLKKIFGNVTTIASNPKFVLLQSQVLF